VITVSEQVTVWIFRFRCPHPDCRYVLSVIPFFLEPYLQPALELQEELMEAIQQGSTVEAVAETSQELPGGGFDERTLSRWMRSWNERLTQLQSGFWRWLLTRVPHLTLPPSTALWESMRWGWQEIRKRVPALGQISFLHGLNRLHFSMAVTVHG
jgi:hypothetical protein